MGLEKMARRLNDAKRPGKLNKTNKIIKGAVKFPRGHPTSGNETVSL